MLEIIPEFNDSLSSLHSVSEDSDEKNSIHNWPQTKHKETRPLFNQPAKIGA